jgi:predicted anti-sigma-YlaC factor YlaD
MQSAITCEECRNLLPEFMDNSTDALQKQSLELHLDECEQCNESLQQLWELQSMSSRWQDEEVPTWSRRRTFFESYSWFPNLQLVSTFASLLVVVLVLSQTQISTKDGLSVHFGGGAGNTDYLTEASLEIRVAELQLQLELQQQEQLRVNVSRLTNQQVATNQLLLKSVPDMMREERRQEFGAILTTWDLSRDQQARQTNDDLHVLYINQLENRRGIENLNRLLSNAALEGNSL